MMRVQISMEMGTIQFGQFEMRPPTDDHPPAAIYIDLSIAVITPDKWHGHFLPEREPC